MLPFVATCCVFSFASLSKSDRKNLTEEIKRRFLEIIEMGRLFKIFEIFSRE